MADREEEKRLARIALVAMAERARERLSAAQWEESIADTPEGLLVGAKEIDVISKLVFGPRKSRFFR